MGDDYPPLSIRASKSNHENSISTLYWTASTQTVEVGVILALVGLLHVT